MAQSYLVVLLTLSLTSALLYQVSAFTEPPYDVTVLKDLYRELNYPQQLVGWNYSGGDPCEESCKGISCNGSSDIFIQINGLELSGHLGDQLFNLFHLKQLNLSHNSLSGPVGNVFTYLQNLKRMDLSNNNFTGDLSTSFQDLKNLTALDISIDTFNEDFCESWKGISCNGLSVIFIQIDELNLSGRPRDQLFNQIQKQLDLSINAEDLPTSSEHQQQPEDEEQQQQQQLLQDGGDDNADEQQENGGDGNSGDGDVQQGGECGDGDEQGGEGGDDDEQQAGEGGDDNEQSGEDGDDDEQEEEGADEDEHQGEEEDDDEQQGGEGGDDNANSWCPRDWSRVHADDRGVQSRERQRQYHLRRKGL